MKHAKHSKSRSNREVTSELYSSSKMQKKDESDIILSHTPKGRKVFDAITKILFALEMPFVIALIVYVTVIDLFPLLYILAAILLLGILVAVHMKLLSGRIRRRHFKRKRIISFVLSICVFIGSVFGMSYMGIVNNAIDDIALGDSENEDQVDDVSKQPFVVYLSGVDTRDTTEIKDKALSDVNMVIVVNPKQKRVLMLSTPRDYYVPLWGDSNKMDKLTHAGTKGIECSMETLEAFYDIKFNYYGRVNFKSVCDIVDAVGGITVNSDRAFSSQYGLDGNTWHKFVEGDNFLKGDAALAYARERKAFPEGDRMRGVHQQQVIEGVIKKAISPKILTNTEKVEDLVRAISTNTKTNFSVKEIKKLISYQLGSMGKDWEFESMSVDGSGAYRSTYSYPRQQLSVIIPDTETVTEAKAAIKAVLEGNPLPSEQTASNTSADAD